MSKSFLDNITESGQSASEWLKKHDEEVSKFAYGLGKRDGAGLKRLREHEDFKQNVIDEFLKGQLFCATIADQSDGSETFAGIYTSLEDAEKKVVKYCNDHNFYEVTIYITPYIIGTIPDFDPTLKAIEVYGDDDNEEDEGEE